MISGIEFLRRKARMTQSEVAAGAGISVALLGKLSVPYPKMTTSLAIYMRIADVFHVAVDDLLELHDEQELDLGDRVTYRSRTENLENCVAVYRREKNLSLEQLGQLLGGKTKECARLGCASAEPKKKHIRILAAHEGITPEAFCRLYAPSPQSER